MDFVTIVFNNDIELQLLKLQAISFKFVELSLIGNIYIFYNDDNNTKSVLDNIKSFYPNNIQSNVKIIYRDSKYDNYKSNWTNQQVFKLLMSKYVNSEYYVVLDSKNHFIRKVELLDFVVDSKPKMYLDNPGGMIKYYNNCLKYFNINCPFEYKYEDKDKLQPIGCNILLSTTPFVFIKLEVLNLIEYIENKEKYSLECFFNKNKKKYCEFYLYSTYLIYMNSINKHTLIKLNSFNETIFANPDKPWNDINRKRNVITNSKCKIFGLHRKAVVRMNNEYKHSLIEIYKNFYDDNTMKFIINLLN